MIVSEPHKKITSSKDIDELMRSILKMSSKEDAHKERFYVIGLNSANSVQFVDLSAIGTINQCCPSLREIIKIALDKNSVSIIVCHNHPCGETNPSTADITFTRKLKNACELMELNLLDHLIVGDGFYSFADANKI